MLLWEEVAIWGENKVEERVLYPRRTGSHLTDGMYSIQLFEFEFKKEDQVMTIWHAYWEEE